ncbi:cytochrome P450 [Xylaria nigripes]|nr:cytochrome P450 [Xylaria nigripes]
MTISTRTLYHLNGVHPQHVSELHKRYGPVVRVTPDELALCSPQVWQDIYGHKKVGQPELPKFRAFYRLFDPTPTSIFDSLTTMLTRAYHWLTIIRALYRAVFQTLLKWFERLGIQADNHQRAIFLRERLISKKEELGLTFNILVSNAELMVFAGSETISTLLSGATYYLTCHLDILKKLVQESCQDCPGGKDITEEQESLDISFFPDYDLPMRLISLDIMMAYLKESLRCYPLVAGGLPRYVNREVGAMIDGHHVPHGTAVSVFQWAVNCSPDLWTDPECFAPERWLGDPK